MKDYIDLTQLPAEKVEAMVLALSKNDFDLLRKYCDELGILYGYPMEEVVNIFSDQLLMNKKSLVAAVRELDPAALDSRVLSLETTISTKADLSALEPIQQLVEIISSDNSDINGRLDEISTNIITLSNGVSTEISTVNEKIDTISNKHDKLAGNVNIVSSDLSNAITKLNTIAEGAEKNKIDTIQLNGKSIQPINKMVNLTNVVVNNQLNTVISELNASFVDKLNTLKAEFDTNLKTLKAETDGTDNALIQDVANINNTLTSKLDISVAKQISGDLSSNIKSLSDKTTAFESQFASINAAVDSNKVRINNLETKDSEIFAKISSVNDGLREFINGSVGTLGKELDKKVSVGVYESKVDELVKKDNELADELTKQESHIDTLKSEIDRHNHELDKTVSAIYVTTTKSMLLPTNGIISIDVATTSIINAQISAMADVFHVTVDEFAEHFNEDLSVVSAAIDAKTDLSVFKPVAENVKQLTISASVNAANILNLSNDISSAVHHCDHLHSNAISLINCLSSSLDTERNYRETSDAKLDILISKERDERISAVEKERGERIEGDKELDRKIETLTEKLLREYAELQKTHTTDVSKLKERYDTLTTSISDEANERIEKDQELKESIVKLEKDVERCVTIVNENKDAYDRHDVQIINLTDTTAKNTANIESLTTRLKDHTEAGNKRFAAINGELDLLDKAINGEKGGDGLAARIAKAEDNIGTLSATTKNTDSKLGELLASITTTGGLSSQVKGNTKDITEVRDDANKLLSEVFGDGVTKNSLGKQIGDNAKSISDLTTTVNNIAELLTGVKNQIDDNDGIADRIDTLSGNLSTTSDNVIKNSADIASLSTDINSISDTLYGNPDDSSDNGLTAVIDNLIGHVFGENGKDGLEDRLTTAEGNIGELGTTTNSIIVDLKTLSDSITTTGGLSSQVIANTGYITTISVNVDSLISVINGTSEEAGLADKLSTLSDVILNGDKSLSSRIVSVEDSSTKHTDGLNSISCTLYGNPDDSTDNGLTAVVDNLLSVIGAGAIGSTQSISERLDTINNNLSGNRDDTLSVFGVYDRIGDIETALSGNKGICERLDGIRERLDFIGKDLFGNRDDTLSVFGVHDRIEDLEDLVGIIPGLSTDVSGLKTDVENLQLSAIDIADIVANHGVRIAALENEEEVDLSPITNRLDILETENSLLKDAVYEAHNSIVLLNDTIDALEKNTTDLSSINGRLDEVETENDQLTIAVTTAQESIGTLADDINKLDGNIEKRVSKMFANAIEELGQVDTIDPTGSATVNDVVNRLNAIIEIIKEVANK